MEAENRTNLNGMMPTYHKLWWTDKKNALAAAATVIVLDSPYQHHDGTAAFELALTCHLHSWSNDVYADDAKAGEILHLASNKNSEYTDDSCDTGVHGHKFLKQSLGFWNCRYFPFSTLGYGGVAKR